MIIIVPLEWCAPNIISFFPLDWLAWNVIIIVPLGWCASNIITFVLLMWFLMSYSTSNMLRPMLNFWEELLTLLSFIPEEDRGQIYCREERVLLSPRIICADPKANIHDRILPEHYSCRQQPRLGTAKIDHIRWRYGFNDLYVSIVQFCQSWWWFRTAATNDQGWTHQGLFTSDEDIYSGFNDLYISKVLLCHNGYARSNILKECHAVAAEVVADAICNIVK